MKKLIPMLLAAALLLSFAACGGKGGDPTTTAAPDAPDATTEAVTTAAAETAACPAALLGSDIGSCEVLYGSAGNGLICADGGFLYYFHEQIPYVYYATHENVVNQRDESSDIFKTLYCTMEGIELLPGLFTGQTLAAYQKTAYPIGKCGYDASLWSYCAAFQTVLDGKNLKVQIFFYQPDQPSSGIVISTESLSGKLPEISPQERDAYPLAYIGRPTKELFAHFSNVELASDYDTKEMKWPVFVGSATNGNGPAPDDASRVGGLTVVSPELEIMPGVMGDPATLDQKLQVFHQPYYDENGKESGSMCCSRIGALNLEWYYGGSDNGGTIDILSKTYF